MSTRGLFVAVALAVALFAGTATAQAAGLTVRQAKRAALRLGHKQQRTQDVVAFQLGRPHRVSRNQIYFPYAARTEGRNFCKGRLTVTRRVRGNRIEIASRIGKQRCKQIPADALAVESATRKLARSLRPTGTRRVRGSIARCKTLDVPRSRRATARAVNPIALIEALQLPNDKPLGQFV